LYAVLADDMLQTLGMIATPQLERVLKTASGKGVVCQFNGDAGLSSLRLENHPYVDSVDANMS